MGEEVPPIQGKKVFKGLSNDTETILLLANKSDDERSAK